MGRVLTSRYVATETAIGIAINALVTTVPILLSQTAGPAQPLHAGAVSLAPQIMMGALMSVMVPALLTRWRQGRGRIGPRLARPRPSLLRTAITALTLACVFTACVLAAIHLALPSFVGASMDGQTKLFVGGIQGMLAAALLTPLALTLLFGRRVDDQT